jgi:hypothetical protein
MTLLARTLKVQAAAWFLGALGFGLVPKWLIERVADQVPLPEYAWVRSGAVMGFVLALLMVLISRRLDDVWWWSWAFVAVSVGLSTVLVLNGAFALPRGSAAWPWWTLGAVHLAFAAADMVGLARAGQEKPFA